MIFTSGDVPLGCGSTLFSHGHAGGRPFSCGRCQETASHVLKLGQDMSRYSFQSFILFGTVSVFWICGFTSVINVGKFSAIFTSNISPAPFLFISGILVIICCSFCNCSVLLGYPVPCFIHSFFSLCFRLSRFYNLTSSLQSFLSHIQSTDEPHQRHSSILLPFLIISTISF